MFGGLDLLGLFLVGLAFPLDGVDAARFVFVFLIIYCFSGICEYYKVIGGGLC